MNRDSDLIVFSHLRWNFVWQRPQHLISRMSFANRIWFVEEPTEGDVDEPRLCLEQHGQVTRVWLEIPQQGQSHIDFGDPRAASYADNLNNLFQGVAKPVVWLYTPMAFELAKQRDPSMLIYDVMDDLSSFKDAPEQLVLRFRQALAAAAIVFTGGRSLFHKVVKQRPDRTYLFPSGVEPEHYEGAIDLRQPRETPVAGYVGVIDERLDLELVGALARRLPDWQIQMVGPVLKIDPATLPQAPNISYPGQVCYDDLPKVMSGFDVGIMPFALNEATRSISPTKTLEYLAAGLPVVSTRVPDVVADYEGVVGLADDDAGFAAACVESLKEPAGDRRTRVAPILRSQHWDSIALAMQNLISEQMRGLGKRHSTSKSSRFDYLVVGAGFAGSVLAERLANESGKRILIVDKRNHIGGNAYDCYDDAGILIHKYGPHIFHTNSKEVFDYLSQFTSWRRYEHRVKASVDGRLVPIPINLDTINELYGMNLTAQDVDEFLKSVAEPVDHCVTSEDVVVSKVGRELYEKFFRNYTRKQWGYDPSELDASVTSRVPTRTNRDDRYFTDTYQAMPAQGYSRMFERMLDHPNIKVMLNTDYREIQDQVDWDQMIYTGPIDEFFNNRLGKLPYRSLEFKFETLDTERHQIAPVVNYPNEHPYTRVTEFKYLTGQECSKTTLVYEYPQAEGEPYYPVPRPENAELYKRYKALTLTTPGVHFVGRLATYKYYNMDQVTAQALAVHKRLHKPDRNAELFDLNYSQAAAAEGK
ncbi:MAG TPA: UDP-galactopyranose mutase [Actinomycetota bacterium]|nr:UDP-galactopyranose mutase [Actinomycetota bacterium]